MTLPKVPDGFDWVCVDFDGVIAEKVYPANGIGLPTYEGAKILRHYAQGGYKVIIHTARHWEDHSLIEEWLAEQNLSQYVSQVICGKPLAGIYIDDRAWNPWQTPSSD